MKAAFYNIQVFWKKYFLLFSKLQIGSNSPVMNKTHKGKKTILLFKLKLWFPLCCRKFNKSKITWVESLVLYPWCFPLNYWKLVYGVAIKSKFEVLKMILTNFLKSFCYLHLLYLYQTLLWSNLNQVKLTVTIILRFFLETVSHILSLQQEAF